MRSYKAVPLTLAVGLWAFGGGARGQTVTPSGAPSANGAALPALPPLPPPAPPVDWQQKLDVAVRELKALNQEQSKTAGAQPNDQLQKQIELQQKQIDTLLRMTQLLADQVKKQKTAAEAVDDLEERIAAQEASTNLAARRDQKLAHAYDDLVEKFDTQTRLGPSLPATLREKFLPTRTNESPLAIYGTAAQEFSAFSGQTTSFRDQTVELRPYMLLNERWLLSANVALQQGTVQVYRAQFERFINDWLTLVVGRFYSPLGFYTERLRLPWVLKTPDPPLMFNQVYPILLNFDGVQLRGARYLGSSPVKLEYTGFVANGLSVQGTNLSPLIYSNLNNFSDQMNDVNNAKAYGGRVGFSIPTIGFIAGISGLDNGAYDRSHSKLNLWDVDANWHYGNWDARFELVHTNQQTPAVPVLPIHRRGLYAQLAYRRYNSMSPFWQKVEWVARFDHVQFDGINLAQTGLNFGGNGPNYARMPLDRNRYTLGVNYWFYPSMALKLAYEIYDELGVPSLRDNGFLAQMVWGF
jgi:hypothetical protein